MNHGYLLVVAILIFVSPVHSQDIPGFADYPAPTSFKGKPAQPVLRTAGDRMFRTRIQEGAKQGPNFAGRYTIITWGCGNSCESMVIVDATDGAIHPAPFRFLGYGDFPDNVRSHEYRLDSRLLIIRGCPDDEEESACASYFYKWTGKDFKLLRKIPFNQTSN